MKILDDMSITRKTIFLSLTVMINFIIFITYGYSKDEEQNALFYMSFFTSLLAVFLSINIGKSTALMIKKLQNSVAKKTFELEKLNKELEKRINEEVIKNREKDKIMYQHSRLAAMGEMVGNIAHQWRQPLNAMTVLIQSFAIKNMNGKLTDEFIEKQVDEGLRLANMMSHTIDDFRNFFSPNRTRGYFDLGNTIKNTINISQEHDINITIKCDDNIKIYGYQYEFSQVILNLLNNSVDKFNSIKSRYDKNILIEVKVEKLSNSIKIVYLDNAGGIKEDIIDRIFEPYFTTKHKSTGTGIGLFMSKQIIQKQMRGDISATNVTMNFDHNIYKCAKFTITLPVEYENVVNVEKELSIA